ncbi:MAG: GNAT family N-acetyltransferase [Bacteroidota bacterium]
MPGDTSFVFSILEDAAPANTALGELVANARVAGDTGDSFLLAFGNTPMIHPDEHHIILAAYDDKLVIGMLTLLLDNPATQPGRAQIARLITREKYRRKGVASTLIQLAEKLASKNGSKILTLETAVGNHAASLYKKSGFKIQSIEPGFASLPDGSITDTVIYWKRTGE